MCGNDTASLSRMHAAPNASLVSHAAAGMLTTNHPSVTGARPVSSFSSRACSTIVAPKPWGFRYFSAHPYVRVGSLVNVTLTVRLADHEVSRRLNVSPLLRLEPGADVVYDPA